VSELFRGDRAAAGDQLQRGVRLARTRPEHRLGVGGTQPDAEAVVGGEAASVDEVLEAGEGEVAHLAPGGGAQQPTRHHDVALLHRRQHQSYMGNESVPIQLAQCRFPGLLTISNAKI